MLNSQPQTWDTHGLPVQFYKLSIATIKNLDDLLFLNGVQLHFYAMQNAHPKTHGGKFFEGHFQSVYWRHIPKRSVHEFSSWESLRTFNWSIGQANPSSAGIANFLHPSLLENPWNGQTAMLPFLWVFLLAASLLLWMLSMGCSIKMYQIGSVKGCPIWILLRDLQTKYVSLESRGYLRPWDPFYQAWPCGAHPKTEWTCTAQEWQKWKHPCSLQ